MGKTGATELNNVKLASLELYKRFYWPFTSLGRGPGAVVKATCLESRRSRTLNAVSGGQCHLIHINHPQKVFLTQFSLNVHKGGLNPHLFHLVYRSTYTDCRFLCLTKVAARAVSKCLTLLFYFRVNLILRCI